MQIKAFINLMITRFRYFYSLLWLWVFCSVLIALWGLHFIFQDNPRPFLGLLIAIPSIFSSIASGVLAFYCSKVFSAIELQLTLFNKAHQHQPSSSHQEKDITAAATVKTLPLSAGDKS